MRKKPSLKSVRRWAVALALTIVSTFSPRLSAPTAAAELAAGATLTILAEPVDVAPAGASAFVPAVAGQILMPGDQVRTGETGVALLTFFDGSESQLGSGGQLRLAQADYDPVPRIALYQSSGVTVNRVIPLPEGGSFRTDTPDATGLVRGTSFVVNVAFDRDPATDASAAPSSAFVLLTDLDGHVGHLSVVPTPTTAAPGAPIELITAGAGGLATLTSVAPFVVPDVAEQALERAAHDMRDVSSARRMRDQIGLLRADAAQARSVDPSLTASGGSTRPSDNDNVGVKANPVSPSSGLPVARTADAQTESADDEDSTGSTAGNTSPAAAPVSATVAGAATSSAPTGPAATTTTSSGTSGPASSTTTTTNSPSGSASTTTTKANNSPSGSASTTTTKVNNSSSGSASTTTTTSTGGSSSVKSSMLTASTAPKTTT